MGCVVPIKLWKTRGNETGFRENQSNFLMD